MKIPEGYMLVPAALQPILDEIERRADKMAGDKEFTVTIQADDLAAVDATPAPPTTKYEITDFYRITSPGHGETYYSIGCHVKGEAVHDYLYYDWAGIEAVIDELNEGLK